MNKELREQVWCSRCGEPYPGPADPSEPYYAGDGKLWVHAGVFLGLGHTCDGEFNDATNTPPKPESGCGNAHLCNCAKCGYSESVDGAHHPNFARSHKFVPGCSAASASD